MGLFSSWFAPKMLAVGRRGDDFVVVCDVAHEKKIRRLLAAYPNLVETLQVAERGPEIVHLVARKWFANKPLGYEDCSWIAIYLRSHLPGFDIQEHVQP